MINLILLHHVYALLRNKDINLGLMIDNYYDKIKFFQRLHPLKQQFSLLMVYKSYRPLNDHHSQLDFL